MLHYTARLTAMTWLTRVRSLGASRLAVLAGVAGLVCAAGAVASGVLVSAQAGASRAPAARGPLDPATAALASGRYDEVEGLLAGVTDRRAALLRARAHIARGRYADAEKVLTGPAASDPAGDEALELGLLHAYLGRRPQARQTLQRLTDTARARSAADLMRLGSAARALGEYKRANDFFRDANRLAPDDAGVNAAWGELFFEKYDNGEALKSFQAALKVDEAHVAANLGLARVAVEGNPPAAKAALDRVFKVNPNHVGAHLLRAEMALDDRRRDDARAEIAEALKVNPNSLEARSLDAAIAFLEARTADFEAQAREALRINPLYGEVYRVVGDHLARNYRFDEAADMVRRGLAIDDASSKAHGDLGMHLLRTGDEPGARKALERSFKDDPYNRYTFNSLDLLDTLDKFETIRDGDIVIRFHPDEVAVMREHALPLAKEALATLSKLYDFTPTGPILVEMFPKHDDFAVRTVGLPGMVGALGACFGRVVTLDSPKARPPGEFNWGETLWHEMAHVITLQMSNNRVPRWLTEGMSVWEERRARPEWGRESDLSFARALQADKALKLEALNDGFSDPRTISLAYYQASLLVDHLVDTYGEPKLRALLRAYGRGLETDAALQETYGVTMAGLQPGFDARLARDYGRVLAALKGPELKEEMTLDDLTALAQANPGSFGVQMSLGVARRKAGDAAGALQAFERAGTLVPTATGENNANTHIAAIAVEQGDTARAMRALEALLKVDPSALEAARQLAKLASDQGDAVRAEDAYRRAVEVDPFDTASQTGLGRLALRRKDVPAALRALRSALATNPPDRASAHADLAEAYLLNGQKAEARQQTLAALEIAPSFERAQDLLLKLIDAGGAE